MKMLVVFILWYFLFIYNNNNTNAYCPNDEDLKHHQCICNLTNNYIKCSSLPNQCRTCYHYNGIYFDEKVNILPKDAFRFYEFFNNNTKKNFFKIEFAQLNILSSNSFSNIYINQENILQINIFKYSSSIIPKRLFQYINIQSKAKINIEIYNITSTILSIEQYAFDGIKFNYESQFKLSILYAKDTIQFESNAGSLFLSPYSYMELYFSNFIQVILNEDCFHHLIQENSSVLIINFDHFQYAKFLHKSFFDLNQYDQSYFHLSLLNFHNLIIKENSFDTITQLKSSLIISIYNLTNNLCLPNKTFNQIKQDKNSTFQFDIHYGQNILFTSNSFSNINQTLQSKLLINIKNSFDIYFSRYSLNNIYQKDYSLINISIKYGQNLIFEDYAFDNINIYHSSIFKIAFQHSRGTLQMASNSFSNINQDDNGELLFQVMNSSDFYFRFNQSTSLKRLEILDESLSSNDICRIANIPSHVPVKLLYDNKCSCTIYYLYRKLHYKLLPSILKDLVPLCYYNMSLNEIKHAEDRCLFKNKIYNCQQMEGEIQINIPQGICHENVILNSNQLKKSSYQVFIFIIFICFILIIICIYILYSKIPRSSFWNLFSKYFNCYRKQKFPIYISNSYQQLKQIDQQESTRKILIKYNSSTEQTQRHLVSNKSNLITSNNNEDIILQLNTNPMSDIEDNNQ